MSACGVKHVVDATDTRHLSLFRVGAEDWVVFTTEGRYIATSGAIEGLHVWVDNVARTADEAGWLEDPERVNWTALGLVFD